MTENLLINLIWAVCIPTCLWILRPFFAPPEPKSIVETILGKSGGAKEDSDG